MRERGSEVTGYLHRDTVQTSLCESPGDGSDISFLESFD